MANRSKKTGVALAAHKRMEERYDIEDARGVPDRIVEWMNLVLEGTHPPMIINTTRTISMGWRRVNQWLRDGVALCKLVNKLLAHAGKPPIKFSRNAFTAFVALENLAAFNKGAVEFGLSEINCFNTIDLYEQEKGPFLHVINCLNELGIEANKQGFVPEYNTQQAPSRDAELWSGT